MKLKSKSNKQSESQENKNETQKQKEKQTKRQTKNAYKSTQGDIRISQIYDGIIVTEPEKSQSFGESALSFLGLSKTVGYKRYVRILEINPVIFSLKTVQEQNRIYQSFASIFTSDTYYMQFIVMSIPASLKKQIDVLDKEMEIENNEYCLKIDREYRKTLEDSQRNGIAHRFFIVFEYNGNKNESLSTIAGRMRILESSIRAKMKACGNEVISEDIDFVKRNSEVCEILYTFFNRNEIINTTYEQRIQDVWMKYYRKTKNRNVGIPIKDTFAPLSINYYNPSFIQVNHTKDNEGTFYSFLYFPKKSYPDNLFVNWITSYIPLFQGVDVSVYFEKMDRAKFVSDMRKSLRYAQSSSNTASQNSVIADNSLTNYQNSYYLKQQIESGQEIMNMGVLITVSGKSTDEVNDRIRLIKSKLREIYVEPKECKYFEEKAFYSALPLCRMDNFIWEKSKRNVLSESAATCYMFDDSVINDVNGIYFGLDENTGSLIVSDIFNRKRYTNSNIFICGTSGAGKSFTLSLIAIRMRMKHVPIYIISAEKTSEFKRLCSALGGQYITVGTGSDSCINIMEIRKRDETNKEAIDGETDKASYLATKIDSLKVFFQMVVKDITIEESSLLEQAIVETYRRKGITMDNESLIDPEDFFHERFKKMPIISDLVDVLNEDKRTERLATIIVPLCIGSVKSFNGQTNVDLDNGFTVIDLENLQKETTLPLGIQVAMDLVWSKAKQDKMQHKIIIMDEWWALAKNPVAANHSLNLAKTIRGWGGSMIVATQEMEDIMAYEDGKFGKAVLNNCAITVIMKNKPQAAYAVQKMVGVNDVELKKIIDSETGHGLFMTSDGNVRIEFKATEIEHKLITTDRDDLMTIAKEKKEKAKKLVDDEELFTINDKQDDDLFFATK